MEFSNCTYSLLYLLSKYTYHYSSQYLFFYKYLFDALYLSFLFFMNIYLMPFAESFPKTKSSISSKPELLLARNNRPATIGLYSRKKISNGRGRAKKQLFLSFLITFSDLWFYALVEVRMV